MSREDNIKIAKAAFDALNAHDVNKFGSLLADDYLCVEPGSAKPLSKKEELEHTKGFFQGFPDARMAILRTIADGGYVVTEWNFSGTSGGKQVSFPASTTLEIKNGKITGEWDYFDQTALSP